MRTVLGIDLAKKSWKDNGSAALTFDVGRKLWIAAATDVVSWPNLPIGARTLAQTIDRYAVNHRVLAISIDGPQGWRDPDAIARPGAGRWCEKVSGTPGKTGVFGVVYPRNYENWIRFGIEVFDALLALGNAVLVNDPSTILVPPLPTGRYYLLECFPTSTWKTSGLAKLPGHKNAPPPVVASSADRLIAKFGLPAGARTDHHDHLQAVVAALPAAALPDGPCIAVPRGEAARMFTGRSRIHRIEGLIWDAAPLVHAKAA